MRHGYKLKRLGSGHPDHRYSYLKNLVSALLHHEMIQTTVPRAKIAARMAEKIITLGKKGTVSSRASAISFLRVPHTENISTKDRREMKTPPPLGPLGYPGIDPNEELEGHEQPRSLIPKVFETLAERYKDRPGGYTRIHKYGMRKGDTAPAAILTLVDGPRDIRFEMLAREVGKEAAAAQLLGDGEVITGNLESWLAEIPKALRKDVEAILQFRPVEDRRVFESKARDFADELAAEQLVYGEHVDEDEHRAPIWTDEHGLQEPSPLKGRQRKPGERLAGMPTELSGLRLAKGALVGEPWIPQWQRKKQATKPAESTVERIKRIEQSHTPKFITQRRDQPRVQDVGAQDSLDKPKILEDVMREAGDVKPASASGLLGLLGIGKRT